MQKQQYVILFFCLQNGSDTQIIVVPVVVIVLVILIVAWGMSQPKKSNAWKLTKSYENQISLENGRNAL